MKRNARCQARGAAALVVGLWLLAAGSGGGAQGEKDQLLPDPLYPKMLERNVKAIQDALKNNPGANMAEKAQTAAVLIAAYAQQNLDGPDGQRRATVRDAALKLADLIKAKKFPDAIKLVGSLVNLPADPKAKKEKVKLIDVYIEPAEVMRQFGHKKEGGWGIFAHLQSVQTKQPKEWPRDEPTEPFMLEMYQVAVSGDLVHGHMHKARPKEWAQYTDELRKSSFELAEALRDKDVKNSPLILSKLTTTCFNCHSLLKVKNTGNGRSGEREPGSVERSGFSFRSLSHPGIRT
jgi:hypothetical protein